VLGQPSVCERTVTFSEWVEDPAEDAPRRRGKPGFRSEVPQRGLPAAGAAVSKENEGRCCSGVDWTWRSGCERIFVAARRGGIPSLRSSRTTGSASTTVKDAPTPLPDARTDAPRENLAGRIAICARTVRLVWRHTGQSTGFSRSWRREPRIGKNNQSCSVLQGAVRTERLGNGSPRAHGCR
jgi:hypothetical protein